MDKNLHFSLKEYSADPASNTEFEGKLVPIDYVTDTLKQQNYSNIIWKGGIRKETNFVSSDSIVKDYDKGTTVEDITSRLKNLNLNFIILTTKSHRVDIPTKDGIQDRFRVIVPLKEPVYSLERYQELWDKLERELDVRSDQSCRDGARWYWKSPETAQSVVFMHGDDFSMDRISPNHATAKTNVVPKANNSKKNSVSDFNRNLEIKLKDGTITTVEQLMARPDARTAKHEIYCPFHDDSSTSAFFRFSAKTSNFFIYCSACTKTWWSEVIEIPVEERFDLSRFWSHADNIFEILIMENKFVLEKFGLNKVLALYGIDPQDSETKQQIFNYLVQQKHIPSIVSVVSIGDATVESTNAVLEIDKDRGKLTVRYPLPPIVEKDNEFIENYLTSVFKEYTGFIKKWLAVYAYSNYRKLATIVLTGDRARGKNLFADMVAAIYPHLSTYWTLQDSAFNPELQSKLLIADETVTKEIKNYVKLKKISGAKFHVINRKYVEDYQVPNNSNIIILSNDALPIFVKRTELSTNPKINQFFIYPMPDIPVVDTEMPQKLAARIGYYARTVLKDVWNECQNDMENRYSMEVPITESERTLFQSSVTLSESITDEIVHHIIDALIENKATWLPLVKEHRQLPFAIIAEELKLTKGEATSVRREMISEGLLLASDSFMGKRIKKSPGDSAEFRPRVYTMTDKLFERIQNEVKDQMIIS